MPSFPIDPEIPLRHRRGTLRTIDEAREFVREMVASHPGKTRPAKAWPAKAWYAMQRQLDRVGTEDDALEAAVALELLLERDDTLIAETKPPAAVRAAEPEPVSGPAASLIYATANAAAAHR